MDTANARLKALREQRDLYSAAIAIVNAEIATLRQELIERGDVEEVIRVSREEFESPRTCQRCGKSFIPSAGATGRWCSQACYAGGISMEARRVVILGALKDGPFWPSHLRLVPVLANVSVGTITNDLYALKAEGLVRAKADGWVLASKVVAPRVKVYTQRAVQKRTAQKEKQSWQDGRRTLRTLKKILHDPSPSPSAAFTLAVNSLR